MRNPPWTRDELILALDTYFLIAPHAPSPSQSEIIELSAFLRIMGSQQDCVISENYRSPASVVMKLMNFRSIDPTYLGKGLTASSRADRNAWDDFSNDKERLRNIANVIRSVAATEHVKELVAFPDLVEAPEGKTLTRMHVTRERDPRLVKSKKKKTLKEQGYLACEICGFDFEKVYGERGKGYIECHHTKPVHTLVAGSKTNLEELALLCPNCHRMIHSKRPWLTVEELKCLFEKHASLP